MMRRQEVDSELSRVTGLDEWTETLRGAVVTHRLDTRLLRAVIQAKQAEAKQPKTRTVQRPLRVVRTEGKRESA